MAVPKLDMSSTVVAFLILVTPVAAAQAIAGLHTPATPLGGSAYNPTGSISGQQMIEGAVYDSTDRDIGKVKDRRQLDQDARRA